MPRRRQGEAPPEPALLAWLGLTASPHKFSLGLFQAASTRSVGFRIAHFVSFNSNGRAAHIVIRLQRLIYGQ